MHIFANWKMQKNLAESVDFCVDLIEHLREKPVQSTLGIFPNTLCLPMMHELLLEEKVGLGAQNIHQEFEGPYTGETSIRHVEEFVQYVLVAHSERRKAGDTPEIIRKKLDLVSQSKATTVLCLNDVEDVSTFLNDQNPSLFRQLILVFEPSLVISDGKTFKKTPAPSEIDEHIKAIQEAVKKIAPKQCGSIPYLYGASVNPENVEELLKAKTIDGFLIGQASWKFESFWEIVEKIENFG